MKFIDWFDVYNIEHIAAYQALQETGIWPKEFIPIDIIMGINWQILLAAKMAEAWLEQVLAGHIIGIPEL